MTATLVSPVTLGGVNGFTPQQIRKYYHVPDCLDGGGQKVAFIESFGNYDEKSLGSYFRQLGMRTPPAIQVFCGTPRSSTDITCTYDLSIGIGMAPCIEPIVCVSQLDVVGLIKELVDTIQVNVICISWGAGESTWQNQTQIEQELQYAASKGVTVVASTGLCDDLGVLVYPATSPWVLAVGATTLSGPQEMAWLNGGGGLSAVFPTPGYQHLGLPHRAIPDVSANADPASGYVIAGLTSDTLIAGGSSAPFWAALAALFNQANRKPFGFLNPIFYNLYDRGVAYTKPCTGGGGECMVSHPFKDIIAGANCIASAMPNYDLATGIGTPYGDDLLAAVSKVDKVCCVILNCDDYNTLVAANFCN